MALARVILLFRKPVSMEKAVRPFVFMMTLLAASTAIADELNVNPNINKHLTDPDYEKWVQRFERPGREIFDQKEAIVRAVNIRSGMDVADIGAGTGLLTRLFAPAVGPKGKVYAVDIAENFIDEIISQAEDAGMNNVIGIVNSQKDTGLKAGSIDLAFVCDTYHHFEYPRTMLRSIHHALRQGGSLIVIDFRKIQGVSSKWVMSHTRADKETVIREIESEGFVLTEDQDLLKANFYLRFNKT
ncbi:MAG: methyltransferase domain-containing protein [Gammaproteobacteria bacterium]|nr:MAG: methyltransferase domain-containing protein [Gammaproteobacteria bacterium]